jgi:hypothetical protein
MSPTQRTLAYLREEGYHAEVVEHYNSFVRRRFDLWGWCDILAIRDTEILAVQCTSEGVASRVKKIEASQTLPLVRKAGIKIWVMGWRKNSKGRYVHRIVDIS